VKNIAILFGGQSAEHEISIISARNIFKAIDTNLFKPTLIGISRTGCFYTISPKLMETVTQIDDETNSEKHLVNFTRYPDRTEIDGEKIDSAFSIIHGQSGEDGIIPGFCEAYNLPYVGCNTLSSAICMDKEMTKLISIHNDIPTTPFIAFNEQNIPKYEDCAKKLKSPFFMKIANLGSSIGVYKIKSEQDYDEKIKTIWKFGTKVLVEAAVPNPQEIEIAIFESDNKVMASDVLGEIKPNHEFYTYEAKYLDPNGADLIVPANVNEDIVSKIKEMGIKIFKAFHCNGLARIDFLVNGEEVFFNEINTLPGFTNISMYPTLFQKSGMTYSELITKLIESSFTKKKIDIDGMMREC
jgi:D-alanine-D-alanine ligase